MAKVAYVGGCGRLGICLATWSAHKGHDTIIVDVNARAVREVNEGMWPISEYEDGAAMMCDAVEAGTLRAYHEEWEQLRDREVIFVIVPTPSLDDGSFSIKAVLEACKRIGAHGLVGNEWIYPIVVIVSTVNPGDTDGPIREMLERESGKKAGEDFGLCYSPEFIRQGSIIEDFSHPELVLIGSEDGEDANALWFYYRTLVDTRMFYVMSTVSAEIAKIGLNAALSTKVAVANQLMWLCQYVPGANVYDVLAAIGEDDRIGAKFFKPGPHVSGPCLPRDNRALSAAIHKRSGTCSEISDAVTASIRHDVVSLAALVAHYDGVIGMLGLTYKSGVDITEESAGVRLARELNHTFRREVFAHDPSFPAVTGLTQVRNLGKMIERCRVLVITTPWEQYSKLDEYDLRGKIVVDCWGVCPMAESKCEKYILLGRGE